MNDITFVENKHKRNYHKIPGLPFPAFGGPGLARVHQFHASIPGYAKTPTLNLGHLAEHLGVDQIWVKDESKRFGLNAFKVLGSSYALSQETRKRMEIGGSINIDKDITWKEVCDVMNGSTLITATDGNHGYGVAWLASLIPNTNCHVLMPHGTAPARAERVRKLGADVQVTSVSYDATVDMAAEKAVNNNWLFIQDTTYVDYEEIPLHIMQGYTTILAEAFEDPNLTPTHIFLQAGVGSFAGSLLAFIRNFEKERSLQPAIVVIVEAEGAECIFESAKTSEGSMQILTTPCDTIMAGLNCSTPCNIAWPIMRDAADAFLCCSDAVAADGMRTAFYPKGGDKSFISGESGAVTLGAICRICSDTDLASVKEALKLTEASKILLISTEGDTDPDGFNNIINA